MKYAGILVPGLIFLGLILLGGCAQTQYARPIGETLGETRLDPCAEVTCPANSLCKEGACVCQQGYKECRSSSGTRCIVEDSCCTDADCDQYEQCEDGTCEFSCELITCGFNKICFEKAEGCYCPDDHKWCDRQEACIPEDHCCGTWDCGRDERCTRTIESGRLCLYGEQKLCKYIGTAPKDFAIDGSRFTIAGKRFYYGNRVILTIDGEDVELREGENHTLGDIRLHLEELKVHGGTCRSREDT